MAASTNNQEQTRQTHKKRIVMKAKPTQKPGEVTFELNYQDESLLAAASNTATKSPFNIKHILVPIDFSDCSRKALDYALPLARENKAVITLLHVADPGYSGGVYGGVDYAYLERSATEDAEVGLTKVAKEQIPDDVSAVTLVKIGKAWEEIVAVADTLPADLIVISTHGRTGLKHVFIGSVAEHVVQRAPCPVFVVREQEREILAA
jgi:universal stress protein A